MAIKTLGAIEALDLSTLSPDFAGLELKIRHVGAPVLRLAQNKLQAARLREIKRVKALIAEYGEAALAEIYYDRLTAVEAARDAQVEALEAAGKPVPDSLLEPVRLAQVIESFEAAEDLAQVAREIVESCAASLGELTDPKEIAAELDRFGIVVAAMNFSMGVQRLSAAEFPSASGASAGGSTAPGSGA